MRVLIVDQECLGLDFALRCAADGHDVRWFRYHEKDNTPNREGEGFKGFEIVDDWKPHMPWAKDGLIICTGNFKFLPEFDRYREHGYKIFAPTQKSAELEIKRSVGMKVLEEIGIEVPPYKTFDSLQSAEAFARKSDRGWVFKTMGDEEDKSLSYVSSEPKDGEPDDLVGWLQQKIKMGMKIKGPCMLQEKIDMLCDYGVSGWFGPDGFLPDKWQICFEHKKLMNEEIGPNTGEQGTVCQYSETEKLANDMLIPLVGVLKKTGHRGDFSVGVGVDKSGKAWPFEFTARCGWPAFWIQTASHKGDVAQWMRDLLDGKDTLKVSYDVSIGVVLAQPRYPYNDSTPEIVEGNPISGIDGVYDDMHLVWVMKGMGPKREGGKVVEGPIYQTSGEYVAVATSLGKTIEKARKKVYGVINQVKFPNMMYRTDIGEKIKSVLPTLHKAGYALQMEYE